MRIAPPDIFPYMNSEVERELRAFGDLGDEEKVLYRVDWLNLLARTPVSYVMATLDRSELGRLLVAIGLAWHDSVENSTVPVVFNDGQNVRSMTGPTTPDAYLDLLELGWQPGVRGPELYVPYRRRELGDGACRECGADAVDGLCLRCSTPPDKLRRMDELADQALRRAMADVARELG